MDMLQLDINQCDDSYYVPNAFKSSHKCDETSSYVSVFNIFSVFIFKNKKSLSQIINLIYIFNFTFYKLKKKCVPILGRGFDSGGYKCECLQGFEYPFEDLITYYDGQLVEAEFQNIVQDKPSRFNLFQCRLAGATAIQAGATIIISILMFIWFLVQKNSI